MILGDLPGAGGVDSIFIHSQNLVAATATLNDRTANLLLARKDLSLLV